MANQEPDLLDELKRRGVFRVAAMYAVVAWLIVQIADATFDVLGVSEAAHRILIFVAAAGFPFAVALGWIYDWRAGKFTRTAPSGEMGSTSDVEVVRLRGRRRIDLAIIVALVLALALALFGRDIDDVPEAKDQPASLVVLPFDDLSPGGDQEYFAHGLSEELMTTLARLPDVRVIGRTSAEAAKRSGKGIEAIGKELGVEAVVDGSVRRSKDRVRVTVQLLRASDAVGLWTETYERPTDDLFSLQAQLAADAAAALDRRIEAASAESPTESLAAYDAYLTGRHLMGRQTQESLMEAEQHFERATRADPEFALAWSGLSDVLSLSWALGFVFGNEVVPRAVEAASRAVDLDPDSAEALTSLGRIQWLNREWRSSEQSLRRAIEKNPSYAFAYQSLSLVLVNLGDFEDGVAAIHRTVDLEPLSPYMHVNLAGILDATRDPRGALRAAQQASTLEPNNQFARFYASTSLLYLGQPEAAREEMLLSPLPENYLAKLRAVTEQGGMDAGRLFFLQGAVAQSGEPCGGPQGAITYAFNGEVDKALTCLEGNIDMPGMYANVYLAQSPTFDSLRGNPRFARVLERAGLADAATPGRSLELVPQTPGEPD
jgi:TolB-like protein